MNEASVFDGRGVKVTRSSDGSMTTESLVTKHFALEEYELANHFGLLTRICAGNSEKTRVIALVFHQELRRNYPHIHSLAEPLKRSSSSGCGYVGNFAGAIQRC